jgi:hypothetical protein
VVQEDAGKSEIAINLTSSSPESAVISLELPSGFSAGAFYQSDGVTEIKPDLGSSTFSQYPTSATSTSEWDAEGYNVNALLGPPDLYPSSGDAQGAWQPSGDELEFSTTISIDIPVFLRLLTVYETWAARKIVKVSTKDHDNPGAAWVTVYERSDISVNTATLTASLEDLVICPTSFR